VIRPPRASSVSLPPAVPKQITLAPGAAAVDERYPEALPARLAPEVEHLIAEEGEVMRNSLQVKLETLGILRRCIGPDSRLRGRLRLGMRYEAADGVGTEVENFGAKMGDVVDPLAEEDQRRILACVEKAWVGTAHKIFPTAATADNPQPARMVLRQEYVIPTTDDPIYRFLDTGKWE